MKRIITLAVIALISFNAAYSQKDPKALQILDAMSAKYQKTPAFTAGFQYLMENPEEGINEGFQGEVSVKGDFYKIKMEEQEVRFDGKYVWTYSKEFEEVSVSAGDEEEQEISISNIFDLYKSGYKYLFLETRDGGATNVVDLVPEDLNLSYFKIRMLINSTNNELRSFKIFDKSGSRYTYKVESYNPDNSLTNSDFTWSDAELSGKELIDFR